MDRDTRVRELYARDRIEQLRYDYAHHLDAGEWAEWGRLFADDAIFRVHRPVPADDPEPFEVSGRTAITDFGETAIENSFELSAHRMHNPRVRVDGETATGRWYFDVVALKPDGYVNWHQGVYEDEYTTVDGDWRFDEVVVLTTAESQDVLEYDLEYVEAERGRFPSGTFPV